MILLSVLLVLLGVVLGYLLSSKAGSPFYPKEAKRVVNGGDVIKIRFTVDAIFYYCELLNCCPPGKVAVFWANSGLEINKIYKINKDDDGNVSFREVHNDGNVSFREVHDKG